MRDESRRLARVQQVAARMGHNFEAVKNPKSETSAWQSSSAMRVPGPLVSREL